jgi:hypothetical protein
MNKLDKGKQSLKKPVKRSTRKMVSDPNPTSFTRTKTAGGNDLIVRSLVKKKK